MASGDEFQGVFNECIQGLSRAEALSCVQYLDETYGYFTTVIIDLVPVYEVCWMIGG